MFLKKVKFSTLPVKRFLVGDLPGTFNPENVVESKTYAGAVGDWIDLGMNETEVYAHIGEDYFPITFHTDGSDTATLERGVFERRIAE
jgi:hypothetical protein